MTIQNTDKPIGDRCRIINEVHRELHERPPLTLTAPAHIHHVAYLFDEQEKDRQKAQILIKRFFDDMKIDSDSVKWGERHTLAEKVYKNGDKLRVVWELHTEFVSYTFTHMSADPHNVEHGPLRLQEELPKCEPLWERIVALDIIVTDWTRLPQTEESNLFQGKRLYGSAIQSGAAQVWTTFQVDAYGWEHYLLLGDRLTPGQAGRQIKRLIEIENYHHLILAPLKEFRKQTGRLRALESDLSEQTCKIFTDLINLTPDQERDWLAVLTEQSLRVADLRESLGYRLSAAHAYFEIFKRRCTELKESRVEEGNPPIIPFLMGRIEPTINSYINFEERLEKLSRELDRASNMMRTRVEMAVQKQNLGLLESMARQGQQRLMLQMTVEGLSVIVLSYYLTGLLGYVVKAMDKLGWLIGEPVVWQGALVPVAIGVAIAINLWVHRKVHKLSEKP